MDGNSLSGHCSFAYTDYSFTWILPVKLAFTCEKSDNFLKSLCFQLANNATDGKTELHLIIFLLNLFFFSKQIENLDPRGIQLSALFMSGVDMALFANDACGQPIPWEHCCPWMYFDGKLFQTKLIKASREKVPLIDLCDGQVRSCKTVAEY